MADVGSAMLSVTSALQAFQSLLPKISDIRKADPANNPDIAADVRMGEIAAASMTMGVGLIASSLTQSSLPTVTALVIVVILVTIYESTLRAERPFENHRNNVIRLIPEGENA